MPDPKIDLEKLKAVKDWSRDLADELDGRPNLMPCKAKNPHDEDCLTFQARRYRLTEMKLTKLCKRCQARWLARMTARAIQFLYESKTDRDVVGTPDYS